MNLWPRRISIVAFVLVGGCASPEARYDQIKDTDREGLRKFRFAESVIKFDYVKDQFGAPTDQIVIASVPRPHSDTRYGMTGTDFYDNWGVVTTLNATYRGDSDLFQEVGVSVADKRLEALQTLGSAASALIGIVANTPSPAGKATLPDGISIDTFLNNLPKECATAAEVGARDGNLDCKSLPLSGTQAFIADIYISKRPVDAIALSSISWPYTTKSFLYSACRMATITLKASSKHPSVAEGTIVASSEVAVADPQWIQTLRFPDKGKVMVAGSCGANSTAEDAKLPTAVDYLNGLITQAGAIKKALDAKDTSGAGSAVKK